MKDPKLNISEGMTDKLVKAGLVVIAFFVGKKLLADAAQNSADDQIDTNPSAGQARALNAAMNPSGFDWMRSFDTTDTKAIYEIAPQITNLDQVKEYYRAQTKGRVLHEDLINELGAEGYDKFLALATHGKSGSPKYAQVRPDIPANYWVITTANAYVRKTPKKESLYNPLNNIVKLVPKGRILGASTGKFVYDESHDVTFLEFWTVGTKKAGKYFFYVAKSQIELLSNDKKKEREKSGKIPLELLAGLSVNYSDENTQAVSIRDTLVYNEHMAVVSKVAGNIIIGFPLMAMETQQGTFIQVKTIQGFIRWVNSGDIKIQNRL